MTYIGVPVGHEFDRMIRKAAKKVEEELNSITGDTIIEHIGQPVEVRFTGCCGPWNDAGRTTIPKKWSDACDAQPIGEEHDLLKNAIGQISVALMVNDDDPLKAISIVGAGAHIRAHRRNLDNPGFRDVDFQSLHDDELLWAAVENVACAARSTTEGQAIYVRSAEAALRTWFKTR